MGYQRKSYSKRKDYMDQTSFGYQGKPTSETRTDDLISVKALKSLPHSSYSLQADPYLAALPTSEPYPILNVFNKTVGGTYAGLRNLDGGNVQQYANSITSKFLKYFDVFRTQIGINYRYLPVVAYAEGAPTKGKALVDEMLRSIAESVSILQSTTYTQMAINHFAVETDLPMGSETPETLYTKDGVEHKGYKGRNAVLYAMAIYYQIVLQNVLNTFNFHSAFRLKQGTAIRNAWNREVAILNSLFGLFNKKAFLSQWESLALIFEGEYVDLDFAKQASMINVMPSRRSNSILDPVLEIQTSFNHPSVFKVWIMDDEGSIDPDTAKVFDDADMKFISGESEGVVQYTTLWEACENINDYLSLEATTRWARTTVFNTAVVGATDVSRYNTVNLNLRGIISCMNVFKPAWADFREALDTTSRAGIVSWRKGFKPSVPKDTDAVLFRNLVVDDIYQLIFSGAANIKFDDSTKRFRTFSLWNMYTGIPEYDANQGGAFLTYSFKNISNASSDSDSLIDYMPVIFNTVASAPETGIIDVTCVAVSRDGKEAVIHPKEVAFMDVTSLQRLVPLTSQNSEVIRVPSVSYGDNSSLTSVHFSCIEKQLLSVFGLSAVQVASSGEYYYCVDPDILSIYQVEIEDTTNESIRYARANAPFRGTYDAEGILGFFGTMKSATK